MNLSPLERVIADQQKEIDSLKEALRERMNSMVQQNDSYVALADAAMGYFNNPALGEKRHRLLDVFRSQGWCLRCEQNPCACENQYD